MLNICIYFCFIFIYFLYYFFLFIFRDAATQVQTESPSYQPLLSEGEGHSKVIIDDIENGVPMTSDFNDGGDAEAAIHNSDAICQVTYNKSKVISEVMKNDLDLSRVSKCDKCDKTCVMCVLHRAQLQLQAALGELENPQSSSQFCRCHDHRHVHVLGCDSDH